MKKRTIVADIIIVLAVWMALFESHTAVVYRGRLTSCDVTSEQMGDCKELDPFLSWTPWQSSVATDTFTTGIIERSLEERDASILFVDGVLVFFALALLWQNHRPMRG